MKDMNQEQIEWTLIRKQIDGCLTDVERECLERWMAGDEKSIYFIIFQKKIFGKRQERFSLNIL